MKHDPYTVSEADTGEWRVIYYDKPVGFGMLTFDQRIQAEVLCQALNDAFRTGHGMGYNAGFDSGTRLAL